MEREKKLEEMKRRCSKQQEELESGMGRGSRGGSIQTAKRGRTREVSSISRGDKEMGGTRGSLGEEDRGVLKTGHRRKLACPFEGPYRVVSVYPKGVEVL